MPRIFEATPAQVETMTTVWRERGGSTDSLTLDAFAALRDRGDISVLGVPEFVPPDSQLVCSVAWGYRSGSLTLVVAESMPWRRQQFTVLHELGHHLGMAWYGWTGWTSAMRGAP